MKIWRNWHMVLCVGTTVRISTHLHRETLRLGQYFFYLKFFPESKVRSPNLKSPKCHCTKCHDILPWHNYVTKIFSKSPKCHGTKCHAILPWHNNGTKNLAKSPKCHLRKCHDIFCQADEQTISLQSHFPDFNILLPSSEFLSPGAKAEINIDAMTMEATKTAMKTPR